MSVFDHVKKSARNFTVRNHFILNIRWGDIKQRGYYVNRYVLVNVLCLKAIEISPFHASFNSKSFTSLFISRETNSFCYLFRPTERAAVSRKRYLAHCVKMFTHHRLMINWSTWASFVLKINLVDYYINHLYITNNLKNAVFWNVALCRSCVNRHAATCSLWFLARGFFCPGDGGDSSPETFFIVTAVKTSNLTQVLTSW